MYVAHNLLQLARGMQSKRDALTWFILMNNINLTERAIKITAHVLAARFTGRNASFYSTGMWHINKSFKS